MGFKKMPRLIEARDGHCLARAGRPDPPPADGDVPHPEEIAVDPNVVSAVTVGGGILGAQRDVPAVQQGASRSWGCQRSEPLRRKAGLGLQRADCSRHPQLLDAPSDFQRRNCTQLITGKT